jgi:DNA repair photolyase
VRWQGQSTDEEAARRLPGLAAGGTVRTFDAPEAMGVRFHEVEAKSAINRVPGEALPFNWTVNPYRGCTHACTYCLDGSTPILMGDGRTKPLADVRPGDSVYGTKQKGSYRRYSPAGVLDHWSTRKKAYRVTLADGTELVASGDHRFLSNRGWKHVTGTESGANCRPHLTLNNRLIGVGHFGGGVQHSEEYRRGYLTGMIRGDGHLGTYHYARTGRANGDVHRFRLALADREGLSRSKEFLEVAGVPTDSFLFYASTDRHREINAIRNSSKDGVERVRRLIDWPAHPEPDWIAGFLAGIFDAEGSYLRGILRISNTDQEILDWTLSGLARIDVPAVLEPGRDGRASTIRVTGGLRSHLRFFHHTDPAILHKRSIAGTALKCPSKLDVVSIEPIGERDLFDITTTTGDFIADGVVSHNCFARPTHRYLDLNAREDFEREIVVKVNVPERLRVELARPSWNGEMIALGTNTDPYQWVEGRYELTRAIWEVMLEAGNPASVLTKSPLLTRDIDLFKRIDDVAGFQASLSIPTLDEDAWRATEPRTPHPLKRIEAVAELSAAGIPVGVLVAPLMPGINDSPHQVERILELCAEAGADSVGGLGLHLKGEVREIFLDWLRSQRPDLVPHYERLYAGGAFLPKAERERIGRLISTSRGRAGIGDSGWRDGVRRNREIARISRRRATADAGAADDEEALSRQSRLF